MGGYGITLTRMVDASPVRVWAVLTDLDRMPEVLSSVTSVERMTDGPYALGTRWRETRKVFGRETTQELSVVENDPLRRTVVVAGSGGAEYRAEFDLTTQGDDTVLTYRFSAELEDPGTLGRLLGKVLGPMGRSATRKAMEKDLAEIAAAAEVMGS